MHTKNNIKLNHKLLTHAVKSLRNMVFRTAVFEMLLTFFLQQRSTSIKSYALSLYIVNDSKFTL